MNRIPCPLSWCEADHRTDGPHIAHHRRTLAENTVGGRLLSVVAVWAEPLDGRRGVDAHVAIIPRGRDGLRFDVTPREASSLAGLLGLLGVPARLTQALATGAEMLAPYDDQEPDGQPHYVSENPPNRTGTERFTWAFVIDVFDALERAGFRKASDAAGGRATGVLMDLCEAYEGAER